MPPEYSRVQLGQLISAIWSKYLELQGGDVEVQRQLLERDRELFQKDQEIAGLKMALEAMKTNSALGAKEAEFEKIYQTGRLEQFIRDREHVLSELIQNQYSSSFKDGIACGMIETGANGRLKVTPEGRDFLKWCILNKEVP
jgi:hypothetical protein